MADILVPGNLKPGKPPNPPGNATDYSLFVNSMAAEIENELDALMQGDGLPPLVTDPTDQSVRDRRRLFVAIARGVVRHLQNRKGAIKVFCEDNQTKPVTVVDVDFG